MKKKIIFVVGSALLLLSACGSAKQIDGGDDNMPSRAEQNIVDIQATNWEFSPSTVTLKKGENSVIRLKGIAGTHGFMVSGLGINAAVSEGETVNVPISTDKAGAYPFRCSIPCGEGHSDMTGVIIIEE